MKHLFGITAVSALALAAFADEDTVYIDNQWIYNAESATWGELYVGTDTDDNTLYIAPYWEDGGYNGGSLETEEAYIGYSDTADGNVAQIFGGVYYETIDGDTTTNTIESVWSAEDLVIGTDDNSDNFVLVGWVPGETSLDLLEAGGMGTLEIDGDLTINGASNGNALVIGNYGTLKITGDMDAQMDGFYFIGSNSVLAVGGTLTGIQDLDGGYQAIQLFGEDAVWEPTNGTVTVGATTDSNTLSIVEGASLGLTNLTIGSAGTFNNGVLVQDSGVLSIYGSIELLEGAANSNYIEISEGGVFKAYADFHHTGSSTNIRSGLQLRDGTADFYSDFTASGGLTMEAGTINIYGISNNVSIPALDGNGTVTLAGTNSIWRANELLIGTTTEDVIPTNTDITLGAVEVYVQDSNILSIDHFELGTADTNMGCSITIQSGGQLIMTNAALSVNDVDNPLVLESGSRITFVEDIAYGDTPYFAIDTGVTYEFLSEGFVLPGADWGDWDEYGYFSQRYSSTNIFNGASAALNLGAYNVHVGDADSENMLIFTNGASGTVGTLSIGNYADRGSDNTVLVTGTGTTFTVNSYIAVGGRIIEGEWCEGSDNNILRVEDMAYLSAPTIYNRNTGGDSGLEIASGALVEVDDYYQGSGALLTIMTDTTGTNVGHLTAGTAEFESGAKVGVDAVTRLTLDRAYTNSIITADTLVINGVTNGTSLSALDGAGGSLVYYDLSLVDGTNIMAVYTRRSLADVGDFDDDSILGEISAEIEAMADAGHIAASNQVETLNGMSASKWTAQMQQLYIYSLPTFEHTKGMWGAVDQIQARSATFREYGALGVYGPGYHDPEQGWQPWVKAFGGFGERDQGGDYNNGYDFNSYGMVLGVDKAFGKLLTGLAGGYTSSTLSGDNGDESDAGNAYGMLYGSYDTESWFADLVISHGAIGMDNTSGTDFDVTSSVDASQTAFYLGVGAEVENPDDDQSMLIPLAGVQCTFFDQDAYTEESSNAVGKDVDGFDRWDCRSIIGAEMTVPTYGVKVDLETSLRCYWLHEFNDDDEIVNYTLVDSTQPGRFLMRGPESNLAQFGLGIAAKLENGIQLQADIDGQWGKNYYSAVFSGALIYEF